MELVLEQTQQGTSYEASVNAEGVEELKRKVKINGEKKEALLILRQKLEHPSDTQVFTVKMEILLEPTSNKLLLRNPVKEILWNSTLSHAVFILSNGEPCILQKEPDKMTIWLEDRLKNQDQSVETALGKLVTLSESHSDDVWKFVTPSESAVIKEALETLAW
ncbi:hypothetical protein Tco_0874411 [Tanacetum coccineum]|uniref:Uncharacterized protein n=1 Tax=Tanacetum coccineum TaxID=301880 RepID=A0ABQ5BLI1_9ASTR